MPKLKENQESCELLLTLTFSSLERGNYISLLKITETEPMLLLMLQKMLVFFIFFEMAYFCKGDFMSVLRQDV